MNLGPVTRCAVLLAVLALGGVSISTRAATYEELFERGRERVRTGDYAAAETELTAAMALRPWIGALYWYRGHARQGEKDFAGARRDFESLVLMNPDDPNGYAARAGLRAAQGDLDAAVGDLDLALARQPKAPQLWQQRASLKRRQLAFASAIADADQAVALKATPEAYTQRAELKRDMDDDAGALADITKAIELGSTGPRLTLRAAVKHKLHDIDGALDDLEQALARDPKQVWPYRHRAMVYQEQGRERDAVTTLQRAVEVAGTGGEAQYVRLMYWIARARAGDQLAATQELAAWSDTLHGPEAENWGSKLVRFFSGRLTEEELFAAAAVGKPAEVREQLCEAWYYAGAKRLVAGEKEKARTYFEKCRAQGVGYFIEPELSRLELAALDQRRR